MNKRRTNLHNSIAIDAFFQPVLMAFLFNFRLFWMKNSVDFRFLENFPVVLVNVEMMLNFNLEEKQCWMTNFSTWTNMTEFSSFHLHYSLWLSRKKKYWQNLILWQHLFLCRNITDLIDAAGWWYLRNYFLEDGSFIFVTHVCNLL